MAFGKLMVAAEAAKHAEDDVCVILDIDSCYEHVKHRRIQDQVAALGFSLRPSSVCLSQRIGPKTHHLESAVSASVRGGPLHRALLLRRFVDPDHDPVRGPVPELNISKWPTGKK